MEVCRPRSRQRAVLLQMVSGFVQELVLRHSVWLGFRGSMQKRFRVLGVFGMFFPFFVFVVVGGWSRCAAAHACVQAASITW